MPFNTQDNGDSSKIRPERPQPIQPVQKKSDLKPGRIIGIVFFILVLAAVIFLLYTYNFLGLPQQVQPGELANKTIEQPQQMPIPPAVVDSTPPAITTTPAHDSTLAAKSVTPVPKKEAIAPMSPAVGQLQLSVYIAAYHNHAVAEEEVDRWRDAGYDAFVYDVSGWSRVALGHFHNKDEITPFVDSLIQAFEQGYWVGPS